MKRVRTVIVSVLACVALSSAGFAGERTHVVRAGESASSIARDYYGSFDHTEILLRYNAKQTSDLRVGEELRVPFADLHVVRRGDTGTVLAQRYLGRPSAWATIARLNGLTPNESLRVGRELLIPVPLALRLDRGETLAGLAATYYGDPSLGQLVASHNGIEDPRRLAVGTVLEIPIVHVRLTRASAAPQQPVASAPPKQAAEPVAQPKVAVAPPAKAPKTPARRVELRIDEARNHFRAGRFEQAREMLESVRERVDRDGSDLDRSDLWELLAFVYVAFDRVDAACEAYTQTLAHDAENPLDPDLVSPKIRRVLAHCASPA